MRCMVFVKANKESEAGALPSTEMLTNMGKFNEELVKAGVMLAGEGLQPSSKGKRITFTAAKPTITDGPFAEAKELVGGFALIYVKSKDEAVDFTRKFMNLAGDGEVELRQVYDDSPTP